MKISVKLFSDKTTELSVDASDTIKTVKSMLHFTEGLPSKYQRLFFTGKELEDDKRLSDYGIKNGSTIQMLMRMNAVANDSTVHTSKMQVFVQTMRGKTITLNVSPSDTILNLKMMIGEKEATPIETLYLIYAGKPLKDENILSDYGIFKESTIQSVIRMVGGSSRFFMKRLH